MRRRDVLTGIAAGLLAPAASAHTLYGQWVVYRRKHLLIGCHRKDPPTYGLAQEVAQQVNHAYPAAKARAARAPHPERLASLIGTDQMEVAVLSRADAAEMAAGRGRFVPYGKLPLTRIAHLGEHILAAHADFPERHGWMLAAALDGPAIRADDGVLARHPGVQAYLAGTALDALAE